jgi:hypothetical protein
MLQSQTKRPVSVLATPNRPGTTNRARLIGSSNYSPSPTPGPNTGLFLSPRGPAIMENIAFWPVCAGGLLLLAPLACWLYGRRSHPARAEIGADPANVQACSPALLSRHTCPFRDAEIKARESQVQTARPQPEPRPEQVKTSQPANGYQGPWRTPLELPK